MNRLRTSPALGFPRSSSGRGCGWQEKSIGAGWSGDITGITAWHGHPGLDGPNILGRARLACRAGFRPDFGARILGLAGLGLAENRV
jgi:hypothetical protein